MMNHRVRALPGTVVGLWMSTFPFLFRVSLVLTRTRVHARGGESAWGWVYRYMFPSETVHGPVNPNANKVTSPKA